MTVEGWLQFATKEVALQHHRSECIFVCNACWQEKHALLVQHLLGSEGAQAYSMLPTSPLLYAGTLHNFELFVECINKDAQVDKDFFDQMGCSEQLLCTNDRQYSCQKAQGHGRSP